MDEGWDPPTALPPLRDIDFGLLPDRMIDDVRSTFEIIGVDHALFYKQMFELDANRKIAILAAKGNLVLL